MCIRDSHQGERVVGVLEGKDAACGVGGRREKLVQHEGRLLAGRDKKSQEALAGFHVGPGQVLDGAGIADDHLGKPRRLQVAQDRVCLLYTSLAGANLCCLGKFFLLLPAGVVLDSGIVCAVVRVLPADADDVLERGLHRFGIGIGQHVGAVFHRAAGAAFVAAGVDGVLHRPGIDGAGILQVQMCIRDRIEAIATRVYRADGVDFEPKAVAELKKLEDLGFGGMPVCMAKTQYSFSDDANKLGAPRGFRITVRNVKVSAGAGFVVALTGDIMTMPGLPKVPAAERIDVDETGKISGLF